MCIRDSLKNDREWIWDHPQQKAFESIKSILSSTETLSLYDPKKPTIVAADASAVGLGAVLMQVQEDGSRRPICYASRSFTETEKRFAVIEKEALAACWACEKFNDYILGLEFLLETDHKPLVPLLSTSDLSKIPLRIQRFRLRMMRYSPKIEHVSGRNQNTADALSRIPTEPPNKNERKFISEVELYTRAAADQLPATPSKMTEILEAQKKDEEISQIRNYVCSGWPKYKPAALNPSFWENRAHLTLVDDILLFDDRLVIPHAMRKQILHKIHDGHLGISKCRAKASSCVWWPGLSKTISDMVSSCNVCCKERQQAKEPLIYTEFPSRAWQRIGTDVFQIDQLIYVLVVDYYSRWIEIRQLSNMTSAYLINCLKSIFACHGIPDEVVSDNATQYSSQEFQEFSKQFGFTHITSSPRFPQSNGMAERAVRTVKELLRKNEDPYLAFLSYRTAPLFNGFSPSQLLMSRRLRTRVPSTPISLIPELVDFEELDRKEETYRTLQKQNFDRRHRAKALPQLGIGDEVWIKDMKRTGRITALTEQPRSFIVASGPNYLRRNRAALVHIQTQGLDGTPSTTNGSHQHLTPVLDSGGATLVPTDETIEERRSISMEGRDVVVPENGETMERTGSSSTPSVTTRSGREVNQPQRFIFSPYSV